MPKPLQFAVVVTTPFAPQSVQNILWALEWVRDLPILVVYLVCDRKSRQSTEGAERALGMMKSRFDEAGIRLELLAVDTYETASRWRLGLVQAFTANPDVDTVLVIPGDVASSPSPTQVQNLKDLLGKANGHCLVVGDYRAPHAFKVLFDALITIPGLRLLFPTEFRQLFQLGLTKLRSEFFAIGRQVFAHFERDIFFWGTDPTVQIVLSCLRSRSSDLTIVDQRLGPFEDAGPPGPLAQMQQIIRFANQLALDRIAADRSEIRGQAAAREREAYEKLIPLLKKLFEKVIEALEERLF